MKLYFISILFLLLLNPNSLIISMPLKYQSEIDSLNLTVVCPNNTSSYDDFAAFRLSFDPIDHEHNFLPNIVFDRVKSIPYPYDKKDDTIKCSRCGSSFYNNKEKMIQSWNNLGAKIKENWGYTHIASGTLYSGDGKITPPNDRGHFGFYENDDAKLIENFKIIEELP